MRCIRKIDKKISVLFCIFLYLQQTVNVPVCSCSAVPFCFLLTFVSIACRVIWQLSCRASFLSARGRHKRLLFCLRTKRGTGSTMSSHVSLWGDRTHETVPDPLTLFLVVADVVHCNKKHVLFSYLRWLVPGQANYIRSQCNLWLHKCQLHTSRYYLMPEKSFNELFLIVVHQDTVSV